MKEIVLGSLLAVLYSASALAASDVGGCDKHEYAEVKDMSTKELVKEYCYNEEIIRIHGETFHKMLDLHAIDDAKKYQASMSECYDEQRKIKTVLTSRKAKEPRCK